MTQDERDRQLQQQQEELRQRELDVRLRELEMEVYGQNASPQQTEETTPLYQTTKHDPPPSRWQIFSKRATNIAKFIGLIVVVVALVKIAHWLAIAIILTAAAGMGYLLFLKPGDRAK